MAYNLTFMAGNETSMLTFIQGVNSNIMNNTLGMIFLIGFAVVMFTSIMFITNDFVKASLTTTFICFTMSLTFVALDLVSPLAIYLSLILTAISIAMSWGKG